MKTIFPALAAYIERREAEFHRVPDERKKRIEELARYLRERVADEQPPRLTFVCTHNSRRSQIAQLWAQAAATHYGMAGIESYSGGTEATAFHPLAVEALRRTGFTIERESEGANPVHRVRYGDDLHSIRLFSKVYDRPPNPPAEYGAVMTCASADRNCPVVPGASMRVALPFDDPGDFDGTPRESQAYDACCRRISREMLLLFSRTRT